MVHTFKFKNSYFVYDIESGNVFKSDRLIHLLLLQKNGTACDLSGYSKSEIEEAETEIIELKKSGLLFTAAPDELPVQSNGEIKALCIHICHDCNLKCGYCFAGGGTFSGAREMMDIKTAKAAIDFLIKKSGKRKNLEIDFFGGEPLLNLGAVKETVVYAREQGKIFGKNFKFTLTTNGVLLDSEAIEYLNREMDNVVISIDGRKEIHDGVRKTKNGKDSYNLILENAKKFRAIRGNKDYYIRGTFTSKNTDFSKDVLNLNDCGFDQISIEPVVLDKNHPLALNESHMDIINGEYEKLAGEYIERRKTDKWFNFFHFMIDLENGPCLKKRLTGCGAGDEYLAVSPGGDLYPCHQFVGKKEYKLGNVFDGGLNAEIRKIFTESNLLTKKGCGGCFAKYFCSGGCAANCINFEGDINKPCALSCKMMKKRFECALAVYATERLNKTDKGNGNI